MSDVEAECRCCGHRLDRHDGAGCTAPWSEGPCRCFYTLPDLLALDEYQENK